MKEMEETYMPSWLPIEVAFKNDFKCGSTIDREDFRKRVLLRHKDENPSFFTMQIERLKTAQQFDAA